MNIALGILVVLIFGFALFSIVKQSRRRKNITNRSKHYSTTGVESGGLYYTSSDIFDNDHHHLDSAEGGADSSWGIDGDGGSDSGGDGGGDGGGGGGGD